jgi:cyclopropane fatty-acyl-phospholipid synthase-like methyltransferase
MLKKLLAFQFRRPSGLLGYYAANFMKKNNNDYIAHVCTLLAVQAHDSVLEIGCGAGYALKLIAETTQCPRIDAIDFSSLMVKKAKKNNRQGVLSDRIHIFNADLLAYPQPEKLYTKIFAINVLYFWNDLLPYFSKIHGLLQPKGRLILYMSSPERLRKIPFAVDEVFNKYSVTKVESDLAQAGFHSITHEKVVKMGFDTYYVCAQT